MKVLIVDDERTTRQGLLRHVNWSKLQIDELRDACDGQEALALSWQFQPDIILCDIRMPRMDGIDFCREIHRALPYCHVIFLSAYSDKAYLKAAIELGVISYVEKPVNIPEIEEALQKAIASVHKSRNNQQALHSQRVLNENSELILQGLLLDCIKNRQSSDFFQKNFSALGFEIKAGDAFRTLIFKFPQALHEMIGERQRRALIHNIIDESFQKTAHIYADKNDDCVVLLLWSALPAEISDAAPEMQAFCQNFRAQVLHKDEKIFVSFGKILIGMENISISYQTSFEQLEWLFLKGYNQMVFYGKTEPAAFNSLPPELLETFQEYLFNQDQSGATALVKKICKQARASTLSMINDLKDLFLNFILSINQEKQKWPIHNEGNVPREKVWDLILGFKNMNQIEEYVCSEIQALFETSSLYTCDNDTVLDVIKMIQSEYGRQDLTVGELARRVYLTPTYLSTLFKKEMGIAVSEYLTQVRIEQAKNLLRQPKRKLYDISEAVGYTDAHYFAKAFKKRENMTPTEYRKKYSL